MMLQVVAMSGTQVAQLGEQELGLILQSDKPVKALKEFLAVQIAVSRFQLRLLNRELSELRENDSLAPWNGVQHLQLLVLDLQSSDAATNEAFISACANNRWVEVVQMLHSPQDPNVRDAQGGTALHSAACNGHLEVVRGLLEAGSDIEATRRQDGATALLLAAHHGHLEVVRALLEAGAELNAKASDGSTALLFAAFHGHLQVVRTLLETGAEVNAKAVDGGTALLAASLKGHLEVVRSLLEAGSDIEATRRKDGATALLLAAHHGHLEVVRALLEAGAELNARADNGATALRLAAGHHELAELLRRQL
ncbi:unnamed protein product [Durusdinium trenchii]|uniref:Uncharacterized protein n=1 Tax=Durusdinium trenchii TaxID=1381693 RepID=A0ABP0NLC8_9DINO